MPATSRPKGPPPVLGREAREKSKLELLREALFERLLDEIATLEKQDRHLTGDEERAFVYKVAMPAFWEITRERDIALPEKTGRELVRDLANEVVGFGPIQTLLEDPTVSEVMVNGPWQVYAERKGKLVLEKVWFRDDSHVMRIINKIVAPLGRRCDVSSPLVDARLPDGSRVNAVIAPLSLVGPSITIRKFSKKPIAMSRLVEFGTLTDGMALFLEACVKLRLNVVISGGTGSGKTTTLNAISGYIPSDERIVTIEDAAELQLQQDHVVGLESRPANIEGKGTVPIRDLVKNTLRMRPDRIIVGECRAGETLDMLQAMNTGHDGSLTSAHANTPTDTIRRLETMVMMAGMDLPLKSIREQIASAVNLIVQQTRLHDGQRRITFITEVAGMEGDQVVLRDIFRWTQLGMDDNGRIQGEMRPTGAIPTFLPRLKSCGLSLPDGIFGDGRSLDDLVAESLRTAPAEL
ncbi:MAG: CpaF family protein [Candidatus Riflebacteria bacterium]|nr:CpaF family protein [Candidatus Riflebacteria bacterium]